MACLSPIIIHIDYENQLRTNDIAPKTRSHIAYIPDYLTTSSADELGPKESVILPNT